MTDASTFHRSSTALVVQGLQNDVVTEGGAFAASGAPAHAPRPFQDRFDGVGSRFVAGRWDLIMTGVPGGGPEPTKSTTPNPGRSRRPRPARRTGPKRATGLSTGHRGKGQDRDPEHLIAVNRKSQPAWGALRLRSPTTARARFEDPLIAMTGNRSAVSATRMRAQITLFGVTIAFVPADQDCRAERRIRALGR